MMDSVGIVIVLSVLVQACAIERAANHTANMHDIVDKSTDKLVDKLVQRTFKVGPLNHTNLDTSTVGKTFGIPSERFMGLTKSMNLAVPSTPSLQKSFPARLRQLPRRILSTPRGDDKAPLERRLVETSASASAMSDEEQKAKLAALTAADTEQGTIFDKILKKEIPSDCVFEDDLAYAFRDISPQAPVHVLVIPKQRSGLTQISKATPEHIYLLGHLMYTASTIAKKECGEKGFRLVINDGPEGCQSVYHLHIHILCGRQLKWPPG